MFVVNNRANIETVLGRGFKYTFKIGLKILLLCYLGVFICGVIAVTQETASIAHIIKVNIGVMAILFILMLDIVRGFSSSCMEVYATKLVCKKLPNLPSEILIADIDFYKKDHYSFLLSIDGEIARIPRSIDYASLALILDEKGVRRE